MRVLIIGQKAFGAAVLELALRKGYEVAGVSSPLASAGGGADRLHLAAVEAGVRWISPATLRAATLPDPVDLIVAAHAHSFIGAELRARAVGGAIGYHPSLLPLHRGRDAIRWALHMRERVTGGSVYRLVDNVDAGHVLAQEHVFIRPGDTAEALWRRDLFPLGLRLLERVLGDLNAAAGAGVLEDSIGWGTPQVEALATWEPAWERPPLATAQG